MDEKTKFASGRTMQDFSRPAVFMSESKKKKTLNKHKKLKSQNLNKHIGK